MSPSLPPVLDFDHHDLRVSEDRPAVLDEVREHPIFRTEAHGGYWVASSYETAKQVFTDTTHFSTLKHDDGSGGVTIPTAIGPRMLPAEIDGAEHRHMKDIVLAKLGRRSVSQIRPMIERLTDEALDRIVEKGDFDVVEDIADMIPAGIIVAYLGFSDEVRVPFIKAVQGAVSAIPMVGGIPEDGPTPEMLEAAEWFGFALEEIKKLIALRKAEPAEDLISFWVQPEHGLSDDEVMWMTFTLVLGGAENPAALLTNTLVHLDRDRELRQRLIDNPSLIRPSVEEFLREITAGISLTRNCVADVEVGGHTIKAGDRVLIWLPAANHDATVFDRPDELDIDREQCPHIAFGAGPHKCPGAFLTRLEFQIVIGRILERIPDYSLDLENSRRTEDASLAYCFRTLPGKTNA